MSKSIFIHCQTFARKQNPAGQSVTQVIAEALREDGYDQHVADPKPPEVVVGDPWAFLELHDEHVARRSTPVVRKGKTYYRPIRHDRHTLFTIIASYPTQRLVAQTSREERARLQQWIELTLGWVRDRYGAQLKVAFSHIDEEYPHLHFWLLPDNPDADARQLHPGKASKIEVEARLKGEGVAPREAVKMGNASLKSAMRTWIDDYHLNVGAPLGFMRDGPKRRRLSRAQLAAEAAMLEHYKDLETRRRELEDQVGRLELVKARETAELKALQKQHAALEDMAGQYLKKTSALTGRIEQRVQQLKAAGPMLDAVAEEIAAGTLSFDPVSGWRMANPEPFQRAAPVWRAISPTIQKLIEMISAAEGGAGQDAVRQIRNECDLIPEMRAPVEVLTQHLEENDQGAVVSAQTWRDAQTSENDSFGM